MINSEAQQSADADSVAEGRVGRADTTSPAGAREPMPALI